MSKQKDKVTRVSEIKFEIGLDAQNIPVHLQWEADDNPVKGQKECKALLMAIWDGEAKSTLRIDLWTQEMEINEMNYFFFQTLATMAATYKRATNDEAMSLKIREFAQKFAKDLKLIPPSGVGK